VPAVQAPTVFQALADPIRWQIVQLMAATDELACVTLETTLPIAKSTISYHIKILHNAELIDVRKDGRNYHYRLRRARLGQLMTTLGNLADKG